MKVWILDAMKACKKEIELRLLMTRWNSRVAKVGAIVKDYQRTFHPHDFYLSLDDVRRIPDIHEAIVDGTDEEFTACAEGLAPRLPGLTSKLLKERTAYLSVLIPFDERPENVLSLATVWFNCTSCWLDRRSLLHGTEALVHECRRPRGSTCRGPASEATLDTTVRGGWCSTFTFSKPASDTVRGLVLDCREDPENITLAEMNSKLYRFAAHESDQVAYSWIEAVSSFGLVDGCCQRLITQHARPGR